MFADFQKKRSHGQHSSCRNAKHSLQRANCDSSSTSSDDRPKRRPARFFLAGSQHSSAPSSPRYKARLRMSDSVTNANYATGLLHVALCGSAGWAMHECDNRSPIALGCFSFLFGHSLIGVLRHTHPNVNKTILMLYQHTQLLAQICPIALITAQVSQHLGQSKLNAYLYSAASLVPTICELVLPEQNERALDLVVLGTSTSLGYMGVVKERYWAMGLAVLTVLNHFSYRPISEQFDVPRSDLITIGLGFFTMFAVNCLAEVLGTASG